MSRWANCVALVTGASAGIGAGISSKLVEHGMTVKIGDELEDKGFPGELIPFKCDVSNEADINNLFEWIEANLGGVDVCVNNAGFSTHEKLLGRNLI
ncbi:unnamed protein product [Allacma fusca]|uniref:Dehydrogenase/reductase SDR family member 11 n=1 Tax=Allacma fusca TaxID=39272 RepID=A0A8J2L9D7_9HEXA|nr:unnamed protein product [Allacma fusca]